jgi:hypothetical protein
MPRAGAPGARRSCFWGRRSCAIDASPSRASGRRDDVRRPLARAVRRDRALRDASTDRRHRTLNPRGSHAQEVHLRHRAGCSPRSARASRPRRSATHAAGARPPRHHREDGPLHQRGSGHDVAVPTRRGVRHRGRRRDRPGSRSLRAVHSPRRCRNAQQLHHRFRSTRTSSSASAGASTSVERCRSSRTSPTRSSAAMHLAAETADIVAIVEVGGTVGDIEGLPFLEAIRQLRHGRRRRERAVHPPDPACRTSRPRAS